MKHVAMIDQRRVLIGSTIGLQLLAGLGVVLFAVARRLRRPALATIVPVGPDRMDIYFAAALAGAADPWGQSSRFAAAATEVQVSQEDADTFYAASLAGDCHPYETAMRLPHPH